MQQAIVGTLVIIGIILKVFNITPGLGDFAVSSGIIIGVILGILGIFGVIKMLVG